MTRFRHASAPFAAIAVVALASYAFDGYAIAFLYVPIALWAASSATAREAITVSAAALAAEAIVRSLRGGGGAMAVDAGLLAAALVSSLIAVAVHRSRVQALTHNDALTGLPNHRGWDIAMQRESRRAARQAYPLTVVLLDIDGFGALNAERGHAAGDDVLRDVAAAWSARLRATDLFARLGGDEFGIALAGSHDDGATEMLGRIHRGAPAGISVCSGIAEWDGEETMDALLHRATAALEQARRRGPAASVMAVRPTVNSVVR